MTNMRKGSTKYLRETIEKAKNQEKIRLELHAKGIAIIHEILNKNGEIKKEGKGK